jgi:hypothetical protein
MDTQQPTPSSPSGPSATTEQELQIQQALDEAHQMLREAGIQPEALAVCMVGSDTLFGEVYQHESFLEDGSKKFHASLFEVTGWISIKNPRRLSRRVMVDPNTGAEMFHTAFTGFDLVEEGMIELRPNGFFFVDWLSNHSQLLYCKGYLGFLEGMRRARAKAAGITIAGPAALSQLPKMGRGS